MDDLLDRIRAIHAPAVIVDELVCEGCDYGGWEGEPPGWPCRTASLVYTDEERSEYHDAMDTYWTWRLQAAERKRCRSLTQRKSPWSWTDAFITAAVFPVVSAGRSGVTYEFVKDAWETNPITFRRET